MFSVNRPMKWAELKCCVTLTKLTWCFSKLSIKREKSISERDKRSTL